MARLQHEIAAAERKAQTALPESQARPSPRTPVTTADFGQAVWQRYTEALAADEAERLRHPTPAEIAALRDEALRRVAALNSAPDALAVLDMTLDYQVALNTRTNDALRHDTRLAALKRELAAGETHQVQHEIDAYLDRHGLSAAVDSAERRVLESHMMRAEIEAAQRAVERDHGNFGGAPNDPVVKAPAEPGLAPVRLSELWSDYRERRISDGFLKDQGRRQEPVFRHLVGFLKHDDALRTTRKDLLEDAVPERGVSSG